MSYIRQGIFKLLVLLSHDLNVTINPTDIDTRQDFMGSEFRKSETETAARNLVIYMRERERGGDVWPSFTQAEVDTWLQSKRGEDFFFMGLLRSEGQSSRYIEVDIDGNMSVTARFIAVCYGCAPVDPKVHPRKTRGNEFI